MFTLSGLHLHKTSGAASLPFALSLKSVCFGLDFKVDMHIKRQLQAFY